jgi:hypothetical protein
MKKPILVVVVAVLVAALAIPVFAGDILTRDVCEANGGVFTNNRGTKTCVYEETQIVEIEQSPGGSESEGNEWTIVVETTVETGESQLGAINNNGTYETYQGWSVVLSDGVVIACFDSNGKSKPLTHQNCQLND